MNLSNLKNEFPFQWRVQSYSGYKPQAICVPYCDARDVQDILDEVCGPDKWQDEYYEADGNLYCKIGIMVGAEWVWKSDCGINTSKYDAEIAAKGSASDAFKRAAVKWGVGRFLYSMRTYSLKANKKKEKEDKKNHLWCLDDKGNKLPDWQITAYINSKRGTTKAAPAADPDAKGDEAAQEIGKLESWLSKYDDKRVLTALKWLGFERTATEFRRDGVADVPRVKFGDLCTLVRLTGYDHEIFDMCLDGFGYEPIDKGGIAKMLKEGKGDKVLDECEKIRKQADESK